MKTFLIVTVFFATIINFGNASSKEEEAQDDVSEPGEPVKLAGSASENAEFEEIVPLAHSMGSEEMEVTGFRSSVEQKIMLPSSSSSSVSDSSCMGKSEGAETKKDLAGSETLQEVDDDEKYEKELSAQGQQKQVGLDYYRVDSGESTQETLSHKNNKEEISAESKQFIKEIENRDMTALLGTNQHLLQPDLYPDFSRRFVLQYPYKEIINKPEDDDEPSSLTPKLAPPELVLQVAKESAILDAMTPDNPSDDLIYKDILRTGNYWNSFWKEDVDPKMLRTKSSKLKSFQAKVLPGSDIYELVGKLKQVSPKLLYVMNKRSRQ